MLDELLSQLGRLGVTEEGYALAEWVAAFLAANACGIYRCDELELLLMPDQAPALEAADAGQGAALHVLSQPYRHGGHTRVARHLLAQAGDDHDVLLTRAPIHPESSVWLGVAPHRLYGVEASGSQRRVQALAAKMASYEALYLYIHPDDVVGAVAVRLACRMRPDLRVGFFNHADHSFSVGIGAAHEVFEISTYGWRLRRSRGVQDRATFVGIPIEVQRLPERGASPPPERQAYAMSAGTAYKFKPVGGASLPAMVDHLLGAAPALNVWLVGPQETDPWWRPVKSRYGERLCFHGLVSHADYLAMLQNAAFFIDSHPKTGGTAFPEALLAGGWVVGLMGGTWGFSLADALRVRDEPAFIERCLALLRGDAPLLERQAEVRSACARFHAPSAVWARIRLAMQQYVRSAPPAELMDLGVPPVLAEDEWFEQDRIQMRLPDRRARNAQAVHGAIAWAHARAFGALHPGSLRWGLTWLVRHAWRRSG